MQKLSVIVASTRPGRAGLPIATWFLEQAKRHGRFEVALVDLKEVDLPMLDEPKHPRLGQYEHEHTRAWSATVKATDAFVIVTPEYNHGAPPALVNAIDYLFAEWAYKPAGFVSYGGISAGTRAVQVIKPMLTALKIMPIPEAVNVPFFTKLMTPEGSFEGIEQLETAAKTMLDELARWSGALSTLRGQGQPGERPPTPLGG